MSTYDFGQLADRFVDHTQRRCDPVRRRSFDIDDPRAKVFRKIGDGTVAGALKFRDKFVRLAEEFNQTMKQPGKQYPLGPHGVRVLRDLLWSPKDFMEGRIDPAITTIMQRTGLAKATVVATLRKLAEHGFLAWVRRTVKTDNEPGFGPTRKQISNAYFIALERLDERCRARLCELMASKSPQEALAARTKADADRAARVKAMDARSEEQISPDDLRQLRQSLAKERESGIQSVSPTRDINYKD